MIWQREIWRSFPKSLYILNVWHWPESTIIVNNLALSVHLNITRSRHRKRFEWKAPRHFSFSVDTCSPPATDTRKKNTDKDNRKLWGVTSSTRRVRKRPEFTSFVSRLRLLSLFFTYIYLIYSYSTSVCTLIKQGGSLPINKLSAHLPVTRYDNSFGKILVCKVVIMAVLFSLSSLFSVAHIFCYGCELFT